MMIFVYLMWLMVDKCDLFCDVVFGCIVNVSSSSSDEVKVSVVLGADLSPY